MTSGAPRHGDREIARGVVDALRPALAPGARPIDRIAARDVAQMLGFTGLDAALAVCDAHAGMARPREVEHLAARIARVTDAAEADGTLAAFHAAEAELAELASHLEDVDWAGPAEAPPSATYPVIEQLAGLAYERVAGLEAARLTAPVAGALRAALDWLGVDDHDRAQVLVQDSALEITVLVAHAAGLAPAGAVLASVEGSLRRLGDDRWALRLPLASARPSFLLLRQGHLGLALPWHAVARLRMLRSEEREQLAEPLLSALAPFAELEGERPAALLAIGLARAWFVADRIVWRVLAEAEDADVAPPLAPFARMVRTEDGQRYWIVEPAWWLRDVARAEVPSPGPRPRPSLLLGPESVEPLHASAAPESAMAHSAPPAPGTIPPPARAMQPPAPAPPLEAPQGESLPPEDPFAALDDLLPPLAGPAAAPAEPAPLPPEPAASAPGFTATVEVLSAEHLLPAEDESEAAAPVPPAAPTHAEVAPRPAAQPRPRRALVVDDSLVARIFLARMLEQRGYPVVTAENAAELWTALENQAFGVVFVDVHLPDARDRAHLDRVLDLRARSREPFAVVVLTRDPEDEALANLTGASLTLRKPFETASLDEILLKLPRLPEDLL